MSDMDLASIVLLAGFAAFWISFVLETLKVEDEE